MIPGLPGPAAQRVPAARLPKHRSNHRRLRPLRVWLPPAATVQSLQSFLVASIAEALPPAPGSSFLNRLHPRPVRTAGALGPAFPRPPILTRSLLFYRERWARVRNRKSVVLGMDFLSNAEPGCAELSIDVGVRWKPGWRENPGNVPETGARTLRDCNNC